MVQIAWYPPAEITAFPSVETALDDPDGLLLMGGDLSVVSLSHAYASGVFPWFSEGDPILWWSPSQRAVIPTDAVHISKNMRKLIKQRRYHILIDNDFDVVITACSQESEGRESTWITPDMQLAYQQLHDVGMAHSVAVYNTEKQLVGGLYGVFVKNVFCGESMFSREPNTSKLALIALSQFLMTHGCRMIDCQLPTPHLSRMGAVTIERNEFVGKLQKMNDNEQLNKTHWRNLWQHCSA